MSSEAANHNNTSRVEEITAILRTEILLGQYRPGERLPSERDLAARFEVNRGVIREALKKLQQLGIADIKPGGVRVIPIEESTLEVLGHLMDLNDIPDPKLILQLFEVFGALMSLSVKNAARTANEDQLDRIRIIIRQLIDSRNDHLEHQISWKELAEYLSDINENLVLRLIGNGLKTQFMGRLERIGLLLKKERSRDIESLKKLEEAMEERDGNKAARAINQHFETITGETLKALEKYATLPNRSQSNG